MAVSADKFRALDVQQFTALTNRIDRIGSELDKLNTTMSRLVDILDEITQAEEVADGSPEQGGTPAAGEAEGSPGYIRRDTDV
jgi:hypothetical protein